MKVFCPKHKNQRMYPLHYTIRDQKNKHSGIAKHFDSGYLICPICKKAVKVKVIVK